jgi:tRNA/tmRNA/rRNA uracil-C5-methylase (TrmA/RlmC/RlmD family)
VRVRFGRDLRLEQARAAGYQISELVVFDMFPGTEHAEVLCALRPAVAQR